MRILPLTIIVVSFSIISGCRKAETSSVSKEAKLITEAKIQYQQALGKLPAGIAANFRVKHLRSVNWDKAEISEREGKTSVSVPVEYDQELAISSSFSAGRIYQLKDLTHLIYQRKGDSSTLFIVTAFPDSNYSPKDYRTFTGIMLVEDLAGNASANFRFDRGGAIFARRPATRESSPVLLAGKPVEPSIWVTTCYQIEGFNYAANNPDEIYSWVEDAGCSSMYYPVFSIGDVGGGYTGPWSGDGGLPSPRATPSLVLVNHGPNLIGDIEDYFKCFTNVGGHDHNYSVTVCVNQPVAGSRQAWSFQNGLSGSSGASNIFNVGHVFLTFNETYGLTNIRRSVGFYPQGMVAPGSETSPGELDNNDRSNYNISLTLKLDNGQFFNMLNFVSQGNSQGYLYDLNSNNCTTFAINALQSAGINIPWHSGSWPGGSGYNPGDMGEDMRSMELGNNMSRSYIPFSHPNQGNCN